MELKQIWSKTRKLLGLQNRQDSTQSELHTKDEPPAGTQTQQEQRMENRADSDKTSFEMKNQGQKTTIKESAEKLSDFDRLIEKLESINKNLNQQLTQNKELTERLDKMPELVKSLIPAVENQERLQAQLSKQVNAMISRDEQFLEAIEQIPEEETRQTEILAEIKKKLSISAETEAKMAEGFRKFNETLMKLDTDMVNQTNSILQMSKTFTTSDRYLKYVMSRQSRRFVWLYVISLAVCLISVLSLVGIIVYLSGQ